VPAHLGESLMVNGDISGAEDLTVEGTVEGTIKLPDYTLTVAPKGCVHGDIWAASVLVSGTVTGTVITASNKVELHASASVEGDIISPRVAMVEGATFHGTVNRRVETQSGR
jgi:cytoskeletal protein CcmA (bactofilin family)